MKIRNLFNSFSIKTKIIFIIIASVVITLCVGFSIIIYNNVNSQKRDLLNNTIATVKVIAEYCVGPLEFSDKNGAEEILKKTLSIPNVVSAAIFDETQKIFAEINTGNQQIFLPADFKKQSFKFEHPYLQIYQPIYYNSKYLGILYFKISTSDLAKKNQNFIFLMFIYGIGLIIFSYIIAARLQSVVSRPVLKLAVVMRRIGETSNYSLRLDEERSDELGTLYKGFNAMIEQIQHRETALNEAKNELKNLNEKLEMKIEERTVKLKEANQELNQALDTLKKTQKHLILSEKMAALGNLVAGIAHEINTPVGVGVTAASHLETKTTELSNKFKNNIMKKSDLEKYLNVAEETNHIILSNLSRAAELIQSFKKIAVGQSSEEKRVFKLKEYIDSMILSLRPKLKHTKHSVIVNCDESIEIDSYPGAFSQIITNFIMNSLMHGFDGIDNGTIKFDVEMYHDHLIFRYSDNGKGISHEYMNKIFNLFFTIKQGQGGSGLGLYILYNIIIQTLRGDITCESVEGEGVNFIIIIPKTVGREKNL